MSLPMSSAHPYLRCVPTMNCIRVSSSLGLFYLLKSFQKKNLAYDPLSFSTRVQYASPDPLFRCHRLGYLVTQ